MGIELELVVLLAIAIVGPAFFAAFELETPGWRKALKWFLVCGVTLALFRAVGHYSLLVPLVLGALGTTVHFVWCRRNGIHPLQATPRRRYYALRGWEWKD
jgi:hypothetical protein